jgi:hypothetical protein
MQDRHLLLQGVPGAHSTQKRGGLAIKAIINYSNAHTNKNVTDSELSVCHVHLCTCARARTHKDTHTDRHSRKCLTVALPPQPAPFPSVAARSRRGRTGTRASARPLLVLTPARQRSRRLTKMLEQLAGAGHWRGVAAQDRAARAVAAAVRTSIPNSSSVCLLQVQVL